VNVSLVAYLGECASSYQYFIIFSSLQQPWKNSKNANAVETLQLVMSIVPSSPQRLYSDLLMLSYKRKQQRKFNIKMRMILSTLLLLTLLPSLIRSDTVEVCHNGKTKRVQRRNLKQHRAHGDKLGSCPGKSYVTVCHYPGDETKKTLRLSNSDAFAHMINHRHDVLGSCANVRCRPNSDGCDGGGTRSRNDVVDSINVRFVNRERNRYLYAEDGDTVVLPSSSSQMSYWVVNKGDDRIMTAPEDSDGFMYCLTNDEEDEVYMRECSGRGGRYYDQQRWEVEEIRGESDWYRIRNLDANCCLDIYRITSSKYGLECMSCSNSNEDQHWEQR